MSAAKRKTNRLSRVTEAGNADPRYTEPEPSTRLGKVRHALRNIDFSYTIFFTDERGKRIKYFCGATVQEET